MRNGTLGRAVLAAILLIGMASGAVPRAVAAVPRAVAAVPRANIILIVSDDQRWDTFTPAFMPKTFAFFKTSGLVYRESFVPNALCCPSRASTLTGTYSHTSGVYGNGLPYGGFKAFDDGVTLATALHQGGYRTLFVGKYLNGYPGKHWTYVPPGWDRWYAIPTGAYYNYRVANNGHESDVFGTQPTDYSGRVIADRASAYIDGTDRGTPYFLSFFPAAPHRSNDDFRSGGLAVPAPRDEHRFADEPPWRPESFGAGSVDDMPTFIRKQHWDADVRARIDRFRKRQLESIYSMDREIARVIAAAGDKDPGLANTVIVFTSDNGYAWGEHTWRGKSVAYEESIRVPLAIHYPDGAVGVDPRLALNVDIVPTVLAAAGFDPATTLTGSDNYRSDGAAVPPEGVDLRATERSSFVLEHWDNDPEVPGYCGVRTADGFAYTRYSDARDDRDDGFEELYDVGADPLQLDDLTFGPAPPAKLVELRGLARALCDPVPPGYRW